MSLFQEDLAEFERQLPSLVSKGETGKYGVGCRGKRFECFDTYQDALRQGYQTHGLDNFVVMLIEDPNFRIPRLNQRNFGIASSVN